MNYVGIKAVTQSAVFLYVLRMMTMMMMTQVVMALLLKHETIERPHRCHCLCDDCRTQTNNDELKFARSRLNSYRALASEAYLSLSTDDPILASFRLRRELLQIAKEEKYYTASPRHIYNI